MTSRPPNQVGYFGSYMVEVRHIRGVGRSHAVNLDVEVVVPVVGGGIRRGPSRVFSLSSAVERPTAHAELLGAQPSAEQALEFGGSYRIPRFIEAGERNSDDIRRAHEVRRIRSYR